MDLVDEVGGGLDGLSQPRALMASGREPGILAALRKLLSSSNEGPARQKTEKTKGRNAYEITRECT